LKLAYGYRSGDLRAVWIPDPRSEALRDLGRAREAAEQDQLRARHRLSTFLRHTGSDQGLIGTARYPHISAVAIAEELNNISGKDRSCNRRLPGSILPSPPVGLGWLWPSNLKPFPEKRPTFSNALSCALKLFLQDRQEVNAPDSAAVKFVIWNRTEVCAVISNRKNIPNHVLKLAAVPKEMLELIP
jgi:hypothetical protein